MEPKAKKQTSKENNPKYFLNIDFEKDHEYRSLKKIIEDNGCYNYTIDGIKTVVYNPVLAFILTKEKLKVVDCDTKKNKIINGLSFSNDYAKGFKEGVEHFKKEYAIGANLYGSDANQYVNIIHNHYFHLRHKEVRGGWYFYKIHYPKKLNENEIEDFGFYAGILSEVDSMVNNNIQIFDKYEKCDKCDNQTKETIKNPPSFEDKNYSQRQIAIAYFIMKITITEKNAKECLKKHSQTTSLKILQKLITKNIQLTTLSGNKTADKKHLQDLNAAKRLMSGIKNTKGVNDIDRFITAFETAFNSEY